jgi:hypothetical protein
MPTLEITLKIPEGTIVSIAGLDGVSVPQAVASVEENPVERYWNHYLSDNARKIYAAAARIENFRGPGYTLEDIAKNLSIDYESVRSIHRTSGRTAKLWREETGTDEPIRLLDGPYERDERHGGMRTAYQLPPGVADVIEHAPLHGGPWPS